MEPQKKEDQNLPVLFTPKNPDGSQRIIKQITVIDPNKLRIAGLDLKMAEALKKVKQKVKASSPKNISKEVKLALAKSLTEKKLKNAQKQKEKVVPKPKLAAKTVDNAVRKLTEVKTKDQPNSSALKTLMPPPPAPPSNEKSHTVVVNYTNPDRGSTFFEVSFVDTLSPPKSPVQIPKASIKAPKKTVLSKNSKTASAGVAISKDGATASNSVSQKSSEVKQKTNKIHKEKCMTTSVPKHQAEVIESKVLSPEEKIDLSMLGVQTPMQTTSQAHKKKLNFAVTTSAKPKEYILPKPAVPRRPKSKTSKTDTSLKPVVEESAVEFIQNLFKSEPKITPQIKEEPTQGSGEDATSFLMQLFNQQELKPQIKPQSLSPDKKPYQPLMGFEAAFRKSRPQIVGKNQCPVFMKLDEPGVISLSKRQSKANEHCSQKNTTDLALPNDPSISASGGNLYNKTKNLSMQAHCLSAAKTTTVGLENETALGSLSVDISQCINLSTFSLARTAQVHPYNRKASQDLGNSTTNLERKTKETTANDEVCIVSSNESLTGKNPISCSTNSPLAVEKQVQIHKLTDPFSDGGNLISKSDLVKKGIEVSPTTETFSHSGQSLDNESNTDSFNKSREVTSIDTPKIETPSAVVPSASRRKGKKSVPVMIAKLNKSRPSPVTQIISSDQRGLASTDKLQQKNTQTIEPSLESLQSISRLDEKQMDARASELNVLKPGQESPIRASRVSFSTKNDLIESSQTVQVHAKELVWKEIKDFSNADQTVSSAKENTHSDETKASSDSPVDLKSAILSNKKTKAMSFTFIINELDESRASEEVKMQQTAEINSTPCTSSKGKKANPDALEKQIICPAPEGKTRLSRIRQGLEKALASEAAIATENLGEAYDPSKQASQIVPTKGRRSLGKRATAILSQAERSELNVSIVATQQKTVISESPMPNKHSNSRSFPSASSQSATCKEKLDNAIAVSPENTPAIDKSKLESDLQSRKEKKDELQSQATAKATRVRLSTNNSYSKLGDDSKDSVEHSQRVQEPAVKFVSKDIKELPQQDQCTSSRKGNKNFDELKTTSSKRSDSPAALKKANSTFIINELEDSRVVVLEKKETKQSLELNAAPSTSAELKKKGFDASANEINSPVPGRKGRLSEIRKGFEKALADEVAIAAEKIGQAYFSSQIASKEKEIENEACNVVPTKDKRSIGQTTATALLSQPEKSETNVSISAITQQETVSSESSAHTKARNLPAATSQSAAHLPVDKADNTSITDQSKQQSNLQSKKKKKDEAQIQCPTSKDKGERRDMKKGGLLQIDFDADNQESLVSHVAKNSSEDETDSLPLAGTPVASKAKSFPSAAFQDTSFKNEFIVATGVGSPIDKGDNESKQHSDLQSSTKKKDVSQTEGNNQRIKKVGFPQIDSDVHEQKASLSHAAKTSIEVETKNIFVAKTDSNEELKLSKSQKEIKKPCGNDVESKNIESLSSTSKSTKKTGKIMKAKINLIDRKKPLLKDAIQNAPISIDLEKPSTYSEDDEISDRLSECSPAFDSWGGMSDDSAGFEDCDPNLTAAMINVATAVEKSAHKKTNDPPAERTLKTREPKNPFKKLKDAENQGNEIKIEKTDEIVFLGFDEKEIEEGQHSTSLRLSQSEDASPSLQLQSPLGSGCKKKATPRIKKAPLSDSKKHIEQQNWKKNSAASLKSWLTTPDKSQPVDGFSATNLKEINLSVPPKKRRDRIQDSNELYETYENVQVQESAKNIEKDSKNEELSQECIDKLNQNETSKKDPDSVPPEPNVFDVVKEIKRVFAEKEAKRKKSIKNEQDCEPTIKSTKSDSANSEIDRKLSVSEGEKISSPLTKDKFIVESIQESEMQSTEQANAQQVLARKQNEKRANLVADEIRPNINSPQLKGSSRSRKKEQKIPLSKEVDLDLASEQNKQKVSSTENSSKSQNKEPNIPLIVKEVVIGVPRVEGNSIAPKEKKPDKRRSGKKTDFLPEVDKKGLLDASLIANSTEQRTPSTSKKKKTVKIEAVVEPSVSVIDNDAKLLSGEPDAATVSELTTPVASRKKKSTKNILAICPLSTEIKNTSTSSGRKSSKKINSAVVKDEHIVEDSCRQKSNVTFEMQVTPPTSRIKKTPLKLLDSVQTLKLTCNSRDHSQAEDKEPRTALRRKKATKKNLDPNETDTDKVQTFQVECSSDDHPTAETHATDTASRSKKLGKKNLETNTVEPSDTARTSQRKRAGNKKSRVNENDSMTEAVDSKPLLVESQSPSPTPNVTQNRKRKRPKSNENTPEVEPPTKILHVSEQSDTSLTPDAPKRRRGRPAKYPSLPRAPVSALARINTSEKKYKKDEEFNPRLLLARTREEIDGDLPIVDPSLQIAALHKDDVQCGLCNGFTPPKKWIQHVSSHYGVGWIVGTAPPLNVKSRKSVLSYMLEFFKVSKVKGLDCRMCNAQRRSALGLLLHLEQCSMPADKLKETRVACEHCKNEYSKLSMTIHVRSCPALMKAQTETEANDDATTPVTVAAGESPLLSNTGRCKRKSVIKAENSFKTMVDDELIPEEFIRYNPQMQTKLWPSNWQNEINKFGKAFCSLKKCPFTAVSVEDMKEHCQETVCPFFLKRGFMCVKCKFTDETIEPVRAHVLESHPRKAKAAPLDFEASEDDAVIGSESSSDSMSSSEEESEEEGNETIGQDDPKKGKKLKKNKKKRRFPTHKRSTVKSYTLLFSRAYDDSALPVSIWYEEFIKTNYSANPLFLAATPSTARTDIDVFDMLLPKSPISMKFVLDGFKGFVKSFGKTSVQPDKWQQLQRFTGESLPNDHIMYVGAPLKCIAWAPQEPLPATPAQYVAFATRKAFDKYTRVVNPRQSRWLVYISKYTIEPNPSKIQGGIEYAWPIETGPVHCVEFLPSGGYAPTTNRLGLLAVGTVDSEVKVYSLPLTVEKKSCDIFPIIQLEPSFVLCLDISGIHSEQCKEYKSQCTSLVWTQAKDHNFIIGGYFNGFVAVWDVSDEDENLNRFESNGHKKFTPVTYFWTTDARIDKLVAHYDTCGLRWIAVLCSTRKLLVYDVREICKPILIQIDALRNVCSSMVWPVVWPYISYGLGDALAAYSSIVNTMSPANLYFGTKKIDKLSCSVNDVHFNAWDNTLASVADNGDVSIMPLKKAFMDVGFRAKTDVKTISSLDVVNLDAENGNENSRASLPVGWQTLDTDTKQKYGIVFGTVAEIPASKWEKHYSQQRSPSISLSRLMRVNRVRFNPNRNVNSLLLLGYENGFLRVLQTNLQTSH